MKSYSELERECTITFEQSGPYHHLWTPEDHPVIFIDKGDFSAGMNILAICSRLVPEARIITFQIMTNHVHLTLAGPEEAIEKLFRLFKHYLSRYLASKGRRDILVYFEPKYRMLCDLQDLRNVIAYNNRNGFVVNPEYTPFSYPWGANAYYFNPASKQRYFESRNSLTKDSKRSIIHSHDADKISGIITLDGYACPMDFCCIPFGESIFRCAAHYFREISRKIESQKKIAQEIGETIYYTDDELFGIIMSISNEKYKVSRPSLLPASAKTEMALLMHNDYNASNKQISRMLAMAPRIAEALFPQRH